jgi:Polyketide cyclase / dehydrase and lipid transport
MYGSLRHEIRIHRSAADVWALAGDATKLHTWFPGIVDCTVDGNLRVITMGTGMPMPEEILLIDHTQRRFQYRITAPLFAYHRGTIDVLDLGDGTCVVVYAADADPRTMALTIGGGCADALDELKRQMETDQSEGAR